MTRDKLEIVLNKLGYGVNTSEYFSMPDVSSIYMILDNCIYPSDTTRFKFILKTNVELMEVYNGKTIKKVLSDGTTTEEFIPESKFPQAYIPINQIAGFTLVNTIHPKEPFKTQRSV